MQSQQNSTPQLFRSTDVFVFPNASSASSLAPTTIAGKSISDRSAQSSVTDRQRAFISPNSSMIHHDEDLLLTLGSLIGHPNESLTSVPRPTALDISTTALSESIVTDVPNQAGTQEDGTSSRRGSGQSIPFLPVGGAASPVTSGAPSPIIRNSQSQRGSNLSLASNSASECHLNIAWASEEDIPYARLPPGRTITVFAPNIRTPAEVFPSQHILVTKCTRMLPPNHAPLAHCAHYHYNRRCLRGDQCGFVHVARFQGSKPAVDPSTSPSVSPSSTSVQSLANSFPPAANSQPQPFITNAAQQPTSVNVPFAPGQQTVPFVLWPAGSNDMHQQQHAGSAASGPSFLPPFAPFAAPTATPLPQMQLAQSAPQYFVHQGQQIAVFESYQSPHQVMTPSGMHQLHITMPQQQQQPQQQQPQQQQFFSVYAPPQGGMVVAPGGGYQWPTPQASPTSVNFQSLAGHQPAVSYGAPLGVVQQQRPNASAPTAYLMAGPGSAQPTFIQGTGMSTQPLSQFPRLR